MNFLLDTHTFLWWITDSEKLGRKARAVLEETDNDLYLSSASVWEMAIKSGRGGDGSALL